MLCSGIFPPKFLYDMSPFHVQFSKVFDERLGSEKADHSRGSVRERTTYIRYYWGTVKGTGSTCPTEGIRRRLHGFILCDFRKKVTINGSKFSVVRWQLRIEELPVTNGCPKLGWKVVMEAVSHHPWGHYPPKAGCCRESGGTGPLRVFLTVRFFRWANGNANEQEAQI